MGKKPFIFFCDDKQKWTGLFKNRHGGNQTTRKKHNKDLLMKKAAILIAALFLFSAGAFAEEDPPQIAVYVTGEDVDNRNKALGRLLLTSLVDSKRYKAVERPGAFFNEVAELDKSRDGAIDYRLVMEIGKRHGAGFVCFAVVTAAADANSVSASVLDLESGEVVATGDAESPLETLPEIAETAHRLAVIMYENAAPPQPEPAHTPVMEPAEPEPEPTPEAVPAPLPPPPEPAAPDTGKPNIAVYVTGAVSDEEKGALGTRILAALVNRGRYRGIERSSTFLAEIDKEMIKQRSGAIDDSQISELGKQFGVKFICIADITPAYDAFQVSARIVNVETAEVAYIGEAFSPRKTALYITWVSDQVVRKMFGEKLLPEPHDPSRIRISAGAGAFVPGGLGGGAAWGNREQVAMPYTGAGAYLFFDVMYAEVFVGYSTGGGKWESVNTDPNDLPDMQRSYLHLDLFVKYPFGAGTVKFFPLMGIGYELSTSGKLQFPDEEHYVFNGKNERLGSNALSAMWVRLGGGLDFDIGRGVYLRSEFLYGMRTANAYENDVAASTGDGWTMPGHGFTLKIGIGMRFAELNF
jgi:hypothetical protein